MGSLFPMEKIIKWTLALIVLVLVMWFFSTGYTKLISFGGLDWNDLSLSEQGKVTNNFNNLASLLNSCSKFNCLCGNEKGFPFAFREEEKIIINNTAKGKSELILMHQSMEISRTILNYNIFLNNVPSPIYPKTYTLVFESGKYSIDDKDGKIDRQAFARIGESIYMFNSKADKNNALYKEYLNMTNVC